MSKHNFLTFITNKHPLILKKVAVLLNVFFVTTFLYAQHVSEIDSLLNVVKTSSNDTIKANTHYELGWVLKHSDLPSAFSHMDTAMVVYKELKLPGKVALSHFQYSVLHRISGDYNKAIEHLNAYQEYVASVKDTANLIFAHFEKGVIHSQMSNNDLALEELYKAYNSAEEIQNWGMLGNISNSIGVVYKDLEKYNEAINIFEKTIKIYEENSVTGTNLANVYNSLGSSYKELKDYDKARQNFDKALQIYKEANNVFGVSITNLNKAISYNEQKQYSKALPLLEKAYELQKKNNFKSELIMTLSSLGEVHYELGNYTRSEQFLEEGLKLQTENKHAAKDLYFELYRVNEKRSNYKKALNYHQTYVRYKDSILDEEKVASANRLEKQFETEKKNKEIAEQQLELQQQESEIQEKNSQMTLLYSVSLLLLIAAILTWLIYKQKHKRKDQELLTLKREYQIKSLEALIEGEEKERFRIAKELHDGVNGDLSAIKYKLSSLLEENNKVINEAITMIDESCKQVRAISHNLIPPSLENFSLKEALEMYCQNLDSVHDTSIRFHAIGNEKQLEKQAEINIFRIVQELVSNSLKHAEANEIHVQISYQKDTIQVTVEDDGKGFDKDNLKTKGIGLRNIDSRVAYLNATVDFMSNQEGTYFTFEIDTKHKNED